MRGDGFCEGSPDDSMHHPEHCLHLRHEPRDFVCCWCGELFDEADLVDLTTYQHGRHWMRRGRPRKDGLSAEPRTPTKKYGRATVPGARLGARSPK